ncbi:MAG TPA: SURF1 family protein [Burkholderiaceae bacterium]|nr:SURF1 family protein [Burkholderiaceae bacterium]
MQAGAAFFFVLFVALGTWQVQRLAWKQALIARVDARVHAAPVAPPAPPQWPAIDRDADEYLRVALDGRFLHDKEALVQASTERGAGFWVLTPLQRDDGTWVLVNRGFVPPDRRDPARRSPPPTGEVHVQGLLRLSEPGGGFLRRNDPAADRWHSRDVAAIAAARGLPADRVAPYFVDAEAAPGAAADASPVPGLTVIRFSNNHLVYAITWYGLALMAAAAGWYVRRADRAPGAAGDNADSDSPAPHP